MIDRATILHNGHVLTMDGPASDDAARVLARPDVRDAAGSRATAIAYAAGRILAVGAEATVLRLAEAGDADVVDLRGAAVLPGFIDSSAHPLAFGIQAGWLDLESSPNMRSALAGLADRSARMAFDAWLEARFDEARWPEHRLPTRDEIDRAVPDRPVIVVHRSGRRLIANSLALAFAGITARSGDRQGSAMLERDEHGEPTGVITGEQPLTAFSAALPSLTAQVARDALVLAGRRFAQAGVTWLVEGDLGGVAAPIDELAACVGAILDEVLPQRLGILVGLARLARPGEDPPTPEDLGALVPAEARGRVEIVGARLSAGVVQAGDGGQAELTERIRGAHRAGWRVATRAIADSAVEAVIAAYAAALESAPRPGHGHRLDLELRPGAGIAEQLVANDLSLVLVPGLVERRGVTGTLATDQLRVAFASEAPETSEQPLDHVRAAAASGLVSTAEALHAWTAGAARVNRIADAGRLAPGLRADLVVLACDPTGVSGDGSAEASPTVLATIVGGHPIVDSIGLPTGR